MAQTIYASFTTIDQGEKAAGALLDHGVLKEDLSLLAGGTDRQEQEVGASVNAPVEAYVPAYGYSAGSPEFTEPGFVGAPAVAATGFLDPTNVYTGDTEPIYTDVTEPYGQNAVGDGTINDNHHAEEIAKSGITTTTPEDAGVGAIKGTGYGLGLGILAGLAALVVPGFGLVLGGGALAAAIGAAALTTGAGAAVGGLVGFLKDQGIEETSALRYQQTVGAGGALLAINLPSNGVDLLEAETVLNKYGAVDISTY